MKFVNTTEPQFRMYNSNELRVHKSQMQCVCITCLWMPFSCSSFGIPTIEAPYEWSLLFVTFMLCSFSLYYNRSKSANLDLYIMFEFLNLSLLVFLVKWIPLCTKRLLAFKEQMVNVLLYKLKWEELLYWRQHQRSLL